MKVRPGKFLVLVVASAAMVATMVDNTAAKDAMVSERIEASCTWVLAQADSYQRQEKPAQIATEVPALNE